MPWGYAATAIVGAYGAHEKNKAANNASDAITDAQRQMYDQTRQDLSPYMNFGQQAIGGLTALNNGDWSGFLNSPDYLAAQSQGLDMLDRSAASRGSLFGGGHTRDTIKFGQGLAAQYLGNFRGSLFNQAQMGQNAAAQSGQFGANAANQIGGAQASNYLMRGDNNSEFASGLGKLFNDYLGSRQAGGSPSSYPQPSYTGLGGQSSFGQQQPSFGNNNGAFNWWMN
jgi:hypothetical protein